jgi:glycosyltransferase involved in cell wall biosynthesis
LHENALNVVVHNGFDWSRLMPIVPIKANTEVKTVVMVANFNGHKDYKTFTQVARIVTAERNDVRFMAVGDGPYLPSTKKAAADVARLHFLGKRSDVERIVSECDICVLCTYVEGISNSIMEYMALGKPVVATRGGGTEELVIHGVTGFLAAPEDTQSICSKLRYLLNNPVIAHQMGQLGKERIAMKFSIGAMVTRTLSVYRAAAAGMRSRE